MFTDVNNDAQLFERVWRVDVLPVGSDDLFGLAVCGEVRTVEKDGREGWAQQLSFCVGAR